MKTPALLLALAASLIPAACAFAQADALNDDVARIVNAHKLGSARVGISIVDLGSGHTLAGHHPDVPLTPASNMKLLTTGASVMVLGSDFTFKTEIIRDGDRLIIRGSGDPSLGDPAVLDDAQPKMTVNDMLAALAGAAQKSGMTEVREIIVDDRVFDREYIHPAWPVQHLDRPYCAEVSGLNFHANLLSFFPGPGPQGAGTPPTVSLEPDAPWTRTDIRARTIVDGKNTAWITREPGDDHFSLRGDVRFQTQQPIEVTMHEPPLFVGRLLANQLEKAGVHLARTEQGPAIRLAQPQESLTGGRTIAMVCTPLADVLHRCNADSENLYAESLMKRVGNAVTKEPGSWTNGPAVVRMLLGQKLGPQFAAATTVTDGSGLSRSNLVAPSTFTRWLAEIDKDAKSRDIFADSLAKPGVGTLKKRFRDAKLHNEVRGKSGFIDGVRCLSGYIINPASGHRIAYSVMVNDITSDDQTRQALDLHEDIVKLADGWLWERCNKEAAVKIGG